MKNTFFLLCISLFLLSCTAKKKITGSDGMITENQFVLVETTEGNMKLELFADVPKHSSNFIKLVEAGFYDGLLFHRVIPQFMIQGGDPNSKTAAKGTPLGNGGNGYKIDAEFKNKYIHKKGALAAARDNNPQMQSSGCQFYIVQGKTFTDEQCTQIEQSNGQIYNKEKRAIYATDGGSPHLDGKYTVYGQLVEGFDVLEKISLTPKDQRNRPLEDVRITKMTVLKKK